MRTTRSSTREECERLIGMLVEPADRRQMGLVEIVGAIQTTVLASSPARYVMI